MKAKKIAIAVLLSVVMVVSSFLVVACDNTKENRWDILARNAEMWSAGDKNIYQINTQDGKLVLDYTKTDTYQYVSGPIGATAEEKESYKTFVLTASMTTSAEWSTLLVKFGDGSNAREFNFELSATEKTYEIDVSDYDLASKEVILLFADSGWRDVTGKITITEMYLTDREINEANRATAYQLPAGNPLPETAAWNHITSDETTVNAGWYDDGRGIYTNIQKQSDGSYNIHGKRKTHQDFWYNALLAFVDSDATTMSAFRSFKLTVKAPAGTHIAVKPFDFYEVKATVPDDLEEGETFTIEVDITGFTQAKAKDEQGNPTEEFAHTFAKTAKVADAQAQNKIYVIWETGNGAAEGDFTIVSAEFSTDKAKPMYTAKEITATDLKVGTEWFSNDFGVYTPSVNATDNSVNVHYNKGSYEWAYMMTYVKGAALQNMTTLTVKVKGPAGVGILVKPYDQQKDSFTNITFTGDVQTIVLDISGLTVADWTADQQILIFIGGGVTDIEGDFTIYSMEYGTGSVTPGPVTPEATQYADGLKLDVNKNFPATAGGYEATTNSDGNTVITFQSQSNYDRISANVDLGEYKMNYIKVRFKGTEGASCMFGVGPDTNQYKYETSGHGVLTGDWQEFTWKLNAEVTGETTVYIIAGFGGTIGGELEIDSWELYYVGVVADGEQTLDINKNWTAARATSTRYDIVTAEGKTTITYKGTNMYDFDPIILYVDLGEGGYSTLTIKFKGPQGGCTTFSVGGHETEYSDGADKAGAMTGSEQTFTYDVSELSGLVEIKLFVGWDYENKEADATFEITQAQLTKAAA